MSRFLSLTLSASFYVRFRKLGLDNVPKAENGLVDHDELGQMLSYRFDTKNPKSLALARVTA